ncbi:hypothetical protein OFB58_25285, partial [Escherichia coli]|nr:hypothetical protein [Escherichia coli]
GEDELNKKEKKRKEIEGNSGEDGVIRKRVKFVGKAAIKLKKEDKSIIIENISKYIVVAKVRKDKE